MCQGVWACRYPQVGALSTLFGFMPFLFTLFLKKRSPSWDSQIYLSHWASRLLSGLPKFWDYKQATILAFKVVCGLKLRSKEAWETSTMHTEV